MLSKKKKMAYAKKNQKRFEIILEGLIRGESYYSPFLSVIVNPNGGSAIVYLVGIEVMYINSNLEIESIHFPERKHVSNNLDSLISTLDTFRIMSRHQVDGIRNMCNKTEKSNLLFFKYIFLSFGVPINYEDGEVYILTNGGKKRVPKGETFPVSLGSLTKQHHLIKKANENKLTWVSPAYPSNRTDSVESFKNTEHSILYNTLEMAVRSKIFPEFSLGVREAKSAIVNEICRIVPMQKEFNLEVPISVEVKTEHERIQELFQKILLEEEVKNIEGSMTRSRNWELRYGQRFTNPREDVVNNPTAFMQYTTATATANTLNFNRNWMNIPITTTGWTV